MQKKELKRKKALLKMLLSDIKVFGPAGNDLARINQLKIEIKNLCQRKPKNQVLSK